MTLLQTTMLMLTASCVLMLGGFTGRDTRWGPYAMLVGIMGALGIIAYNIFVLTART